MFDRKGVLAIERDDSIDEDELTMQAIELGAEDFESNDEGFEITTSPEDFNNVRDGLQMENTLLGCFYIINYNSILYFYTIYFIIANSLF